MKFTYEKLPDGNYEVLMWIALGEKFRSQNPPPRRLAYCTHEDDAKCIAEAMAEYQKPTPERKVISEYWYCDDHKRGY